MLVRDHTNDTLRFWYDGAGRRFRKSSGTDTLVYAYDGIYQTCELDAQGNVKAIYVYTNGLLLAKIEVPPAGAIRKYFCHHDGLGSIIGMTDTQGNVVQSYLYDEFGRLLQERSAMGPHSDYRYTSQEYDGPISELYNYRARYYDPEIGRFTQEDVLRELITFLWMSEWSCGLGETCRFLERHLRAVYAKSNPQVLNAYGYVANNPVFYNDPTGEYALAALCVPSDVIDARSKPDPCCPPGDFNSWLECFLHYAASKGEFEPWGRGPKKTPRFWRWLNPPSCPFYRVA
ncbi:MAG: RHS repeat domain-containing protein, partial [bacterium]